MADGGTPVKEGARRQAVLRVATATPRRWTTPAGERGLSPRAWPGDRAGREVSPTSTSAAPVLPHVLSSRRPAACPAGSFAPGFTGALFGAWRTPSAGAP